MKINYRNCEIECTRDKSLSGDTLLFYSIFTKDRLEIYSGFSYEECSVREYINSLKRTVDDYIENPEYYEILRR